jgi:hypothetical protein
LDSSHRGTQSPLSRARPSWAGDVTAVQHCPTGVMETLMTQGKKPVFNQGFRRLSCYCRDTVIFIE